ncbi:uncharacterized protein LOC135171803 [Diachasmimorpha longicaudata]|uniref:uncharacterized protein LOC135171803 n=1 Tax=Diachasmimorpha longicaudata TaxID=58733 RepID=UPI0030B8945F
MREKTMCSMSYIQIEVRITVKFKCNYVVNILDDAVPIQGDTLETTGNELGSRNRVREAIRWIFAGRRRSTTKHVGNEPQRIRSCVYGNMPFPWATGSGESSCRLPWARGGGEGIAQKNGAGRHRL